jgi:hypothetical protein
MGIGVDFRNVVRSLLQSLGPSAIGHIREIDAAAFMVSFGRRVLLWAFGNRRHAAAATVLRAGSPRPGFTTPGVLESEGTLWIGTGDYKAAEVTWYEVSGGALSPAWGKSVTHFTFQVSPARAEVGAAAGR